VPNTQCGFLLNPKLTETEDFKDFIRRDPQHRLGALQVKRISITPADMDAFVGYESKLTYEFFSFDVR
jgi:hypothetical protein